jgi:hypothetical protein
MDKVCIHCDARYWEKEQNTKKHFTGCCENGKVSIPPFSEPPAAIRNLLWGLTDNASAFLTASRRINTAVSFASIHMQDDRSIPQNVPSLRVNGRVYHNIGPLYANNNAITPKFLQLYFVDGENQETAIQNNNNFLQLSNQQIHMVQQIIDVIKENNQYYNTLRAIYEQYHDQQQALPNYVVKIVDKPESRGNIENYHERRYNAPVLGTCEFGGIIVGGGDEGEAPEDIGEGKELSRCEKKRISH